MNARMASSAVLIPRISHIVSRRLRGNRIRAAAEVACAGVTLQAHREHHRTFEQLGVDRAMWIVTGLTSIHSDRRVLINKWPALIDVTLQARLLIGLRLL